jgi:[protein-PII] uridylyltransferase
VRPTDGLTFAEKDWQALNKELDLAIAHRLGLSHRLYQKLAVVYGRRRELLTREEPRVVIDNEASAGYTVIEVYGYDREGQLYKITQTLADFGINIYKAYIATEVERLIDVFYVLDGAGEKVEQPEFKTEIINALLYSIGFEKEKK